MLLQTPEQINYNEQKRIYLTVKPSRISKDSNIIVGLHGYGDSAKRFAYYTGLHNVASKNDIIIYPQANEPTKDQKSGWNADFCCGSGWKQGVDDSGFIAMLIKKAKQDNNLADSKVFVTGFSNGAFMSQKIAIDHPDLIDGVAVVSGSIGTQNISFKPKIGIPIILTHGAKDETIPLNGGFKAGEEDLAWLPFLDMYNSWKEVNNGKYETKKIIYQDNSHQWPDWRITNFWHKKPAGSQQIINFFDGL